jgi:hypothetical protein
MFKRAVARSFGLNVPQDIFVVGFAGKRAVTELTAIRFDGRKVGLAAALHMEKLVWQRRFRCRKPIVKRFKGSYAAGGVYHLSLVPRIRGCGRMQPRIRASFGEKLTDTRSQTAVSAYQWQHWPSTSFPSKKLF